jgi:hypothetical protein
MSFTNRKAASLTSGAVASLTSGSKNVRRVLAAILAITAILAVTARNPPRVRAADSGLPFTTDRGKFRILQGGSELGTEEFELTTDGTSWIAKGDALIKGGGAGDMRSSGQLRMAPDGTPLRYDWTAQTKTKVTGFVDFTNGTAKTSTSVPGKNPVLQDFHFDSAHIAVLDNNLYDQYAILARLYDWNAKGAQMFPVIIPQDVTPGMITVESQGRKSTEGGEFDALRVSTSDLEVDLYFDAKHRLMRLEVPAAKAVIVRQ